MNKIIKHAAAGACSIILGLGCAQPASALFAQCDNYINVRKEPYIQSSIVGYIYNNNIADIMEEENDQGWIKIKSGNVVGWCDSQFFVQDIPESEKYTVAIIHPQDLSVYIQPDKESTIYTTVYENQEIECVNYENDWLTLAFEDGSFGFIDAYQAQLKTYYGTAQTIHEENTMRLYQQPEEVESIVQDISENYQQPQLYNQSYYYKQQPDYYNYDIDYSSQPSCNVVQSESQYYIEINQQIQPIEQNFYSQQQIQPIEQENDYEQYEQQVDYEIEENDNEQITYQQEEYQEEYQQDEYQQEYQQEEYADTENSDIVSYADQYLGNPYLYGGNSLTDGIDCSHFVWQVLSDTGHYDGGYATSDGWTGLGESVDSLDNAVAGDVIVYPGHVAIYDGQGGIVQAKGSAYGITHDRDAEHGAQILAIRHFD